MLKHLIAVFHPFYRFRSSETGQYVTKAYALLHPRTTEREKVK